MLGFDSRVEFYTDFNMLWGFQYKADTTIWQSLNKLTNTVFVHIS